MAVPRIGGLLKSTLTGDVLTVKKTGNGRVLLQSLDGTLQVLTGRAAVDLFYEEIPDWQSSTPPFERFPSHVRLGK
jgi:hypothetical protein